MRRLRHKKQRFCDPFFALSPKPIARFRWKRTRLSLFRPQPHLPSFIQMHASFRDLLAKMTFRYNIRRYRMADKNHYGKSACSLRSKSALIRSSFFIACTSLAQPPRPTFTGARTYAIRIRKLVHCKPLHRFRLQMGGASYILTAIKYIWLVPVCVLLATFFETFLIVVDEIGLK